MADRTPRLIVTMPDRQRDGLRVVSVETGLSVAEILRRMVDFCFRDEVLNQLVPCMSGQVNIRGK